MNKEANIHITEGPRGGWIVESWSGPEIRQYGSFRLRFHAEAFGRAVAHGCKVDLIVHPSEGVQIRYGRTELSYPLRI